MATVMCQGLPSAFVEPPQKAEPPLLPAVTLQLKLGSPRPANLGGWSFLQDSLSSANNPPKESATRRDAYAPSFARQPSLKLSDRSLQLCTENLGSETGTDGGGEGDSIFSLVTNPEPPRKSPTTARRQHSRGRKAIPAREIPPPLTTLRGPESLQVRSHREEGRLVIDAVTSPPRSPCFRAERADGRLRLSILQDNIPSADIPDQEIVDELQDMELIGDDLNRPTRQLCVHVSHWSVEEETRKGIGEDEHSSKDMESLLLGEDQDHPGEAAGENTPGKLLQMRMMRVRCKDREHDHHHRQRRHHHHQNSWEPLWVATS